MDFFNFRGHRKTSDKFLKKIKNISLKPEQLIENLNSLGIYNTIAPEGTKILLSELSNSVNLKLNSNGTKCLSGLFPNLFGKGESISVYYNGNENWKMGIKIPYISSSNLYNTNFEISMRDKKINDKNISISQAEFSVGTKNNIYKIGLEKINKLMVLYKQYDIDIMGYLLKIKAGVSSKQEKLPFLKICGYKNYLFEFNPFFVSMKLGIGRLFGKTNITENFIMEPEIKGYKSMSIGPRNRNQILGGKSFISLNNRIGFYIKNVEVYLFGDIGVNSIKGLRECYELVKINDGNTCVGKSIGIGASLKNNQFVSIFYSFPLCKNENFKNYGFNMNVSF